MAGGSDIPSTEVRSLAITVVLLGLTVGAVTGPVVGQSSGPTLDCVGSGTTFASETDSGLTVYENDSAVTFPTLFFPDGETIRIEYPSDGINLSAPGPGEVRLDDGSGPETCLGRLTAVDNNITVAPDSENDVTFGGDFPAVAFRDVAYRSGADGERDIVYDSSSFRSITFEETGLGTDSTVLAISTSDGSKAGESTVSADGSVTFTDLPTGTTALDLRKQAGGELSGLGIADQGTSATIPSGGDYGITALVTNPSGFEDTYDVRLEIAREAGGTVKTSTTSPTVEGDSVERVVYTDVTASLSPGDYEVTASTDADQISGTLTVREGQSRFVVDVTETNSPVQAGETLTVDVSVENRADRSLTEDVSLLENAGQQLDTTSVALDAGESRAITLTWDTKADDAGSQTLLVNSETDSTSTQVTVQSAGSPAPEASDDSYSVTAGEVLDVAPPGVLANDNGETLTVTTTPVTTPSNGSLTLAADGGFTYTPSDGFLGEDTFTYEVTDVDGSSDTATVDITVEEGENPNSTQQLLGALRADGEISFQEVIGVIQAYNDDQVYGATGVTPAFGDVLAVIEAFNEQ